MSKRKIFTLKNKRHMPAWLAWLLAAMVKLIALTYRVTVQDPYGCRQRLTRNGQVVAIWHNRILFIAPLMKKPICRHCRALISASRDGEYVSAFIRFFGIVPVRGSSSRGGARALLELCHVVKSGFNAVLTLDGPRGPRYTVHPGAVAIANRCQVPIIPVAVNARGKWQLGSWDKMQIPKPFSRVNIVLGEPWTPDPGMDVEEAGRILREKLLKITED